MAKLTRPQANVLAELIRLDARALSNLDLVDFEALTQDEMLALSMALSEATTKIFSVVEIPASVVPR